MATLGLKFRLDDLQEEPRPFEGTIAPAELDEVIGGMLGELGYRAQGPARIEGTAYRAGKDVVVEARFQVTIGFDCVRCLDPLGLQLDRMVQHVVVPGGPTAAVPEAGEVIIDEAADAEDEIAYYTGEEVDLAPLLREDILLELPMNPTCVDTQAGKCERFDTVLAERAGAEAGQAVDPRWAPLIEIRKKLN